MILLKKWRGGLKIFFVIFAFAKINPRENFLYVTFAKISPREIFENAIRENLSTRKLIHAKIYPLKVVLHVFGKKKPSKVLNMF